MRFMLMHKMTEELEKGLPPEPAVMAAIGAMIEDAAKQRVFVGGEGLKPSAQRVHIAYKNGQRILTEGPFAEPKELIAGFALLRVRSKEEAIAWCDRFGAVLGDSELFLGPLVEPWDFGAPKPDDAPLRFLAVHQLTERADQGPSDPQRVAQMRTLLEEMKQAAVLEASGDLGSTRLGARIRFQSGKQRVIDGPFAESKELVAGYAIFELPSKAAAIEWGVRFGEVVHVNEVEVRELLES